MFTSSSGQRRRLNFDGSIAVFCNRCGEFIADSNVLIGSALCELCRRVLDGEELTNEMITTYKMSKGPRVDVSMLIVPDKPRGTKFTLRSLGGDMMETIGFSKKKREPFKSKTVADKKVRQRLFEKVDFETDLGGGIGEIDKELNRQREEGG